MDAKDHSRKAGGKHVEKARQEHFPCDHCGETFVSEAAREAHQKVGLRKLIPEVRRAEPEKLIVADGFSCKEQVRQTTNRRPLHLAQVLKMGIDEREGRDTPDEYPERAYPDRPEASSRSQIQVIALAGLVGAALAGGTSRWFRRRS